MLCPFTILLATAAFYPLRQFRCVALPYYILGLLPSSQPNRNKYRVRGVLSSVIHFILHFFQHFFFACYCCPVKAAIFFALRQQKLAEAEQIHISMELRKNKSFFCVYTQME